MTRRHLNIMLFLLGATVAILLASRIPKESTLGYQIDRSIERYIEKRDRQRQEECPC